MTRGGFLALEPWDDYEWNIDITKYCKFCWAPESRPRAVFAQSREAAGTAPTCVHSSEFSAHHAQVMRELQPSYSLCLLREELLTE